MDFLQLLSCACIIFTVGMFTTGLTDLKKMKTTQSADNVQFLPFLTTCLNNLGWLYYGLLKGDGTVISVNIIGAFLQTLYIITYCHYAKDKWDPKSETRLKNTGEKGDSDEDDEGLEDLSDLSDDDEEDIDDLEEDDSDGDQKRPSSSKGKAPKKMLSTELKEVAEGDEDMVEDLELSDQD